MFKFNKNLEIQYAKTWIVSGFYHTEGKRIGGQDANNLYGVGVISTYSGYYGHYVASIKNSDGTFNWMKTVSADSSSQVQGAQNGVAIDNSNVYVAIPYSSNGPSTGGVYELYLAQFNLAGSLIYKNELGYSTQIIDCDMIYIASQNKIFVSVTLV